MKMAFFDVETTGLSPTNGDKICEIGILCCDDFKIKKSFSSLVNPLKPIHPSASMVNGITDEMVKDAPQFHALADDILELFSDRIIVCHNVPFDMKFLQHELSLLNKPAPDNPVMDTLLLARKFFKFPSNSLQNLANHYKISPKNKHRALADVHTTRKLLMHFFKHFDKNGIDIYEFYAK
ncbi:MAG: hypothetical protein A3J83_09155 [Elusimicrobia bacterium RIFOXYA2_FULL_40_6]|nr:MAG: hypothetical protein A3J83_09155 [Elusimicrobia bacterium RIFOXYA2_FULL_40_6]